MRNVLQFDGTNDYIAVPKIDVSETAYTACMWIKVEPDYPAIELTSQKQLDSHFKATPTPANFGVFSVDAGVLGQGGHDREIYFQDGKLCARLGSSNPEVITTDERFDDGVWHQVTHVFGGDIGGQRLYVDGKLVAKGDRSSSDFSGQTGINLGFANSAGHPYFKGQLADVSVWSIARAEADVENRFKQRLNGSEEGLLGLWRLDEGHNWEYEDNTKNSHRGVIENPTFSTKMDVWTLKDHLPLSTENDIQNTEKCTLSMWLNPARGWDGGTAGKLKVYIKLPGLYFYFEVYVDSELSMDPCQYFFYDSSGNYGVWPFFGQAQKGGLRMDEWAYFSVVLEAGKIPHIYVNGNQEPIQGIEQRNYHWGVGKARTQPYNFFHPYEDSEDILVAFLDTDRQQNYSSLDYKLAEVTLWNTAHTSEQIKQGMYAAPLGGEQGLLGLWTNQGYGNARHASVKRPYSVPDQAPRWNHHSELQLILPEHFKLQQEHSEARLRIGSDSTNEAAFKGIMDSVRIWNTTRSDEQIRSHWNQILQGTEADLQAYYRFDEGSGNTLTDLTSHNNNGSLGTDKAHPSWLESSLLLMDGMAFDGQNDYVALPEMEVDYKDGFTVEAWICLEHVQDGFSQTILELGDIESVNQGCSNTINFSYNPSIGLMLGLKVDGQGGTVIAQTSLEVQQWIHVAVTMAPDGNLIFYKNGTVIHQQGSIPLPKSVLRKDNYIGRNYQGNDYYNGRIDELRIWNIARTPEQIRGYMRRQIPPTHPKLVAAYSFEEGFGATAFDSSGNSYHGFLGGGNVEQEPQWQKIWASADRGLQFDGHDDYIALPEMELDFSSGLTLETWISLANLNSQASLIDFGNGSQTDNIVLVQSGSDLVFRVYKNNRKKELKVSGKLQLNRWTHVSVTVDSDGNGNLYVDGVVVKTGKLQLPNTVTRTHNYLGKSNVDANQYFHGCLDDIRIWTIARSAIQVKGNIHRRLFPDSPGLAAYYPTEDGFGQILPDKTNNAYHGSFGGGNASQMPKWIADSPLQFEGFAFDGVKDYVWVENNAAFNLVTDFSISAWVKPNAFQGIHTIVSKATSIADGQYALSMDGEKLRFDYHCEGNDFSVVAGQIRDGWNHVAVTVETNTTQLYQAQIDALGEVKTQAKSCEIQTTDNDGNPVTQTATQDKAVVMDHVAVNQPLISLYVNGLRVMSTTAPKATKPSDADLNIGCLEGVRNDHFFAGAIDSVVIRSKAMTQLEIYEDMNQRLSSSAPEVAGYWRLSPHLERFDYVNDLSGGGHKGTFDHYFYHFFGIDADDQAQRALKLSNGGYVQLDSTTQLTPSWTIEAYFRAPLPQTSGLVCLIACDNSDAPVAMENGLVGSFVGGSFHATQDGRLERVHDGWHHITAIGQGNRTTFYLDDDTEALGTVYVKSQGQVSKIGGSGNGHSFGVLDEVQVWNSARELKDIQNSMRSALIGTETGLLGYWRFELGRGVRVEDHTPNRNHGTITGQHNQWLPGSQLGLKAAMLKHRPDVNALEFDGQTQYASADRLPTWNPGEPLTLQAWIKPHQTTDNSTIAALAGYSGGDFKLAIADGHWRFSHSSDVSARSEHPANAKMWTHIAGVYDGQQLSLYINGQQAASTEFRNTNSISSPQFGIARHPSENSDYFQGEITEVSLWKAAHPQAQLQDYSAQTLIGNETNLVGYWNVAEPSGNTIADRTGNGHNCDLHNNPTRIKKSPINLSYPPVCFHFDGSESAIELVRGDILHISDIDFTIEAWIKPERLGRQQAVLASDDGKLFVGIKNNKTYFRLDGQELIGNDKLTKTNVWYHIAWSYSCTTGQTAIILDYRLDNVSHFGYSSFISPGCVTDILRIGAQGSGDHFQGCISDVRVWDTVRSGDHVCLHKFCRLSGTEKGLLGYWPLDDIDGNYAMDDTPLRNYGIVRGNCKRVPLGEIKMDLSAVVEMPPAQHQALIAQYEKAAIPVNPQTRAKAEGIVPAPGTTTTTGQLTQGGGDLPVTKQATKTEKFFDLDTSGLPEPLKTVADAIVDAINDEIQVPKGELILTSDMLKPFDPFGELFGFQAELLHVKNVGLEIFGEAKLNTEKAAATIGIRLSGDVSIGSLGPIGIEASFYKGKDAKLFDRKKILKGIKGQVETKTVPVNNDENGQENNNSNNQNGNNANNQGNNQENNQQQDGKKKEEAGSLFSYLIKFNLPEPTGLGAAFKGVPVISGLNLWKPTKEEDASEEEDDKRLLALMVTNDEDEEIDLVPYFDGYGTIRFETADDPVFKVIGTLLGLEEVNLHVAVAPQNYSIEATDKFDKELLKDTLWFKELGMKFKLATTPTKFDAALSVTFLAIVQKQELSFVGSIDISTGEETALTGSLSMKGDWRKPFGIEALVISNLAAEVAGSPESPTIINRVGMTGKLAIGKTSAKLAVMVDVDDPDKFVLVADGENIRFGDIINSMCGPHVMSEDTCHHLNDLISIRTYKVSVIPKACAIGQIKFDEEGITIKIAVTIMDWSADLYVRVDYHDGVTAYATIDPIHWLDGLLVIRESEDRSGHDRTLLTHCPTHVHNIHTDEGHCQVVTQYYCKKHPDQTSDYAAFCRKCDADAGITNAKRMEVHTKCGKSLVPKHGPQFYLRLSPSALPEIYVSGYAEILGISLDAFLHISKQGFEAELQGNVWGLFRTDLYMKVASDLSYVHLRAEMQSDFFAKIRECAVAEIHRLAHQAEQKIEGAKAKVEAADRKVQGLTKQINEMRAEVRREREAALRAFRNARDKVNAASRHVDSLLDEIESTKRWFNSLPTWDWPWHESKVRDGAWFGIKIGGLYTAYGVAKGVLWAANKVLQGLSWITRVLPIDLDPRVAGLILARDTAHGLLVLAEAALDGVDDVVKAAAAVAEQILKLALGELFDVRYAKFEGEFGGPQALARVQIQAKIVFMKQNLDINFWFDKNDIAGSIASLAKNLIYHHAPA